MILLTKIILTMIIILSSVYSECLVGASIRPTLLNGVMQQPASQYYHYVYGAELDLAKNQDAGLFRAQYLQRPIFKNAGYSDQDSSAAFFFGSNLISYGSLGATAFIGGGYAWGYIQKDQTASEAAKKETYRLPGISTSIEARWSLAHLDMRLSHQVMICQNSKDQATAYVAWPFTWFLLSISSPINVGG
jgi:hypothetical protein